MLMIEIKDFKRDFFIELAQKKGFNPSIPENWYKVNESSILSHKVCFIFHFLLSFVILILLLWTYEYFAGVFKSIEWL